MAQAYLVGLAMDNPAVGMRCIQWKSKEIDRLLGLERKVEMENDWWFADKDYYRMMPIFDEHEDAEVALMDAQNLVNQSLVGLMLVECSFLKMLLRMFEVYCIMP